MDGILLGVAGAGTAAVTASVNTNLTENKVNAVIDESTIRDADKVSVKSESTKKPQLWQVVLLFQVEPV